MSESLDETSTVNIGAPSACVASAAWAVAVAAAWAGLTSACDYLVIGKFARALREDRRRAFAAVLCNVDERRMAAYAEAQLKCSSLIRHPAATGRKREIRTSATVANTLPAVVPYVQYMLWHQYIQ